MDFGDFDVNLNVIKEALNADKIKLWIPPYYDKALDGTKELKTLASSLSNRLSLSEDEVLKYLLILQEKAVKNLMEREVYQSTGLACLKVRSPRPGESPTTLKIHLGSSGKVLKEMVAQQFQTPQDKIKLICKGRVIGEDASLQDQGVKHGAQIMTLLMTSGHEEMTNFENNYALLDATKRDVGLLAGRSNPEGESYLQITDQSGKTLDLPKKERKALVLAMTLHEKGRTALKKDQFDLALVLLLEAEKEFSECNSKLLEQVDNYGLLSLDMAWCYLNLRSLSQLPDAQLRLQRCEKAFHKSYGPNLERLVALKGSTGNEAALFVRLHLLQAILFYHQGETAKAKVLLDKVEDELKALKVDDDKLSSLIELGFLVGESRMALRESKGDLNMAVTIMENKRVERKKVQELEKKERILKKEREKLGKCVDGSYVEPQFYKSLVSMGYTPETARWALSKTNNRISDAVALIQEHPEGLPPLPISDDAAAQVASLGFDFSMAMAALRKNMGDINRAVEELMANGGVIDTLANDWSNLAAGPSTSRISKVSQRADSLAKENDAYSRLSEGIAKEDDDYLNLALNAEEAFLRQYKEMLAKV